ncbi:restriction endonuclease subunit S [Shewanella algae]|uniref:restriction endonuclease subunit S n=1 Tax=Shewanella algae TaxID=38313 RepID=UPI001BEE26DE|nr:restriction endonuclease subunit S [Shewanella algae]BCV51808.1 hypothetical protein TUM17383_00550 [Shewanella algae]
MNKLLQQVGIRDESFELLKVSDLIKRKVIEKPLDGNHGEIHPKGDDFVASGVPFVMASDIKDGRINYSSCKYITTKQADSLRKGFAKNGDVLLTHKATIGRTALVDYEKHPFIMLTPQVTYYRIVDTEKLDSRYLMYYFNSSLFQQTLNLWAGSGSTRAYLGITAQHNLPVILPPITKQRKIAAVLSAYDDLIENNKFRIVALEKIAEEIYREWFVRFRFPGYQTAEFEKGVPKGWNLERVDSIGKVVTGKTPSTDNSKFYGGDIHFVKTPDMHGQTFIHRTEEALSLQGLESQPSQIIPANSICVSCIGTGGVVSITTQTCSTNQQINSVIPANSSDLYWAFSTLRSLKPTILAFGATGATMTNLSKGKFAGLKVLAPPKELRKNFSETLEPTYEQIKVLCNSINILQQQKDLLLPRLISGKLSVDELDIQFPPSMQDEAEAELTK